MNRVKLDDRIENALNAFFETDTERGELAVTYGVFDAVSTPEPLFLEKAARWSVLLRELLLFGPGTFFLFYLTLTMIFFYPVLGLTFQGLFMLFSAAFMTYAGSGNIKETRNLAVPGVVITIAAIVAFVSSLFPATEQPNLYFWYSIYLFPNALIAAKLVQMWLSEKK